MKDFLALLQSKEVIAALAGVLMALNKKYGWIEIDNDTLIVLVSLIVALIVAGLRQTSLQTQRSAKRAEDAASVAASTARTR